MTVANITRHVRFANETGISGAEAPDVEIPTSPDQTISASTEEEVTVAIQAVDLQLLCLVCDQAVPVQVLETRFAILDTANGGPSTITHTGDLEQEIFEGDLVRIEGTVGGNGVYLVSIVDLALGVTTISLVDGQTIPAVGEGAVGTVCRVASLQQTGYSYAITSTTLGTGAIVLAGNLTDKFAAGDYLIIANTAGNNGLWLIMSVTVLLGVTTIIVSDPNIAVPAGALPATEGAVGTIFRASPAIMLAANSPFLWSIDSGIQNPFISTDRDALLDDGNPPVYNVDRGKIVAIMVDNTDNAVAANFDARIATNSNIF